MGESNTPIPYERAETPGGPRYFCRVPDSGCTASTETLPGILLHLFTCHGLRLAATLGEPVDAQPVRPWRDLPRGVKQS